MLASGKILTRETINQRILQTGYAVRGELAIRAEELRNQLERDPSSLPFSSVINCNLGNPQQLGQPAISFFRQVSALLECPELLEKEEAVVALRSLFSADAIARAKSLSKSIGSVGAYTHSKGLPIVRKAVASFIELRDGFPAEPEQIFLTNGASEGLARVLGAIIKDENVGIMIPIPQYPLYSAILSLLGGKMVPYYLNESANWALELEDVKTALHKARKRGVDVRAMCIINPGNPAGNCFSESTLKEIIQLCHEERLLLLADEVYQRNVYDQRLPFISAKKALRSMGAVYDDFELFSFHSVSKGLLGECGRRGGYFECVGIDKVVIEQFYKLASLSLCPNVPGQVMVGLMVDPPQPGDPSFELYETESDNIRASLKRRARRLEDMFNGMEGVSCEPAQGALYLFPKFAFPPKMISEAKQANRPPDEYYALALLNATGVCVVPGTGFGQAEGTYHVRSTFLPSEDQFDDFTGRVTTFHANFMAKYHDAS